ncbi:MAG TPA: hypothetical protein VMQ44_00930 [Candidatus Saccharimonadales bacterium]|nr:hypothetical protein [Candidatus Saccharimonadales bacterium]
MATRVKNIVHEDATQRLYIARAQQNPGREESRVALGKIIENNRPMVIKTIKRQLKKRGLPITREWIDILLPAGNDGLTKATFKFKLAYRNTFLTYAGWWIMREVFRAISRELADRNYQIDIPMCLAEKGPKNEWDRERLRTCRTISLNQVNTWLAGTHCDDRTRDELVGYFPQELCALNELRDDVLKSFHAYWQDLPELARNIVALRIDLELSFPEIAKICHVCHSHARETFYGVMSAFRRVTNFEPT